MMRAHFGTTLGNAYWGDVPSTLTVAPSYCKANDRGGSSVAEVEITGTEAALWEVLAWLGRPVTIYGDMAQPVWWGMVNEARVTVGAATYTTSLDGMYNRIAVAYTESSPDGAQDRLTTDYAEDAGSIARYGTKETVYSLGQDASTALAVAKRDQILAKRAYPAIRPALGGGDVRALVLCVGWTETLRWRTFNRLEGRIEHEGNASVTYPVGWRVTGSTSIGMYNYALHDLQATLGGLQPGHVIVVDSGGSPAYNDGPTTVASGATSDGVTTYVANTVFFDPDNDIYDNAQGLAFLRRDEFFNVSGSAQNSQVHLTDGTGAGYVTTKAGITGAIVGEAVGPTITITQGHKVDVATNYAPLVPGGGTFTVYLRGERLAQSFVPSLSMTATYIGVQAGKTGSPSDNLAIDLCANSSGAPGTVLATATLTAADVPTLPGWVWWTFTPGVALSAGTTYWLVVRRTGSVSAVNHWVVQMTSDASGSCLAYDASTSTWGAEAGGNYLAYKVWSAEDTGAQMRRIMADCGQFFTSYDIPDTGILSNPYRANDMTGEQEFFKLLEGGTSGGQRLIAKTTPQRSLVVSAEPLLDVGLAVRLQHDGSLWRNTTRVPNGYLPVGEWCLLDVPQSLRSMLSAAVLVAEAQYDADRGLSLSGVNDSEDVQL